MKLFGRDISTQNVLAAVTERLFARGLTGAPGPDEVAFEGVEARVDPLSFYVNALGEHTDVTRGLPMETHRDGLPGRAVVAAKSAFRRTAQIFINEALGRQVVFNGHVRDSYSQLSAEVVSLRARITELETALAERAGMPVAKAAVAKVARTPARSTVRKKK